MAGDDCPRDIVVWIPVGVTGVVLDFDVDPHPGAGFECVRKVGDPGSALGKFGARHGHNGPVCSGRRGIVVNDEDVVGSPPHVEFDGIGPERCSKSKRLDGVLLRLE